MPKSAKGVKSVFSGQGNGFNRRIKSKLRKLHEFNEFCLSED